MIAYPDPGAESGSSGVDPVAIVGLDWSGLPSQSQSSSWSSISGGRP